MWGNGERQGTQEGQGKFTLQAVAVSLGKPATRFGRTELCAGQASCSAPLLCLSSR